MNIIPPTQEQLLPNNSIIYNDGSVWQKNINKPVIINKWIDKYNAKLTNGRIVSKRMLNRDYKFIGFIDSTESDKKVISRMCGLFDGCLAYTIICKCGEEMHGWSDSQVQGLFDIHICIK
jgi:hypothetical protein